MTVQDVYNAFQKKARNSVVLYSIGKKIEAGTATMEDAAKYNATISTILGKVIGDNILKIPESERVKFLHWILQEQYKDTNERLAVIQKFLDKHTGIDLEPQKAPFPKERVQQLGTSLTDRTVPDETIQRRARAGSANIAASFHDDYVKENAKFRSNAGMKCYLERKVSGKCCPWCRALAGRYVYGSEPADLFRRHDNCTCQVTYESGRTRQNVWTKKTWEERPDVPETPKPTVFSHEQAKQTEAEALRKMGLTKTADGGIIQLYRKNANSGAFASLEIPMQKRSVTQICKKYGIDIDGISFKIQRDESFLQLSVSYFGSADPDNIGRIDLFPNAFADEEQLVRTIIHEKTHIEQLKKHGKEYCQKNLAQMEKEAYQAEDAYMLTWTKR